MPGTLFVVATPIGNLEDLTFRALRTLREVDIVAAEDTRRTSKLLAHYDVRKTLVSLHEHNENREASRLIEKLASGLNVALVSDAGTPTIADPGHHEPGGRIGRPQARLHPGGRAGQEPLEFFVRRAHAAGAEIVELEKHDRQRELEPSRPRERVFDPIAEQRTIGQTGQRIVERWIGGRIRHRG
jgi:hypothetical protein